MTAPELPTRRLRIVDVEKTYDEILAFFATFPEGERKWCEVWYPAPESVDPEEWERDQVETFDAVELVDGEIVTVPPYAEIEAQS